MCQQNNRVTVGTPVTGCPPYRSVRAELPHTAPALSIGVKNSLTHSLQTVRHETPALYPVRGVLLRVPLGRCTFLCQLRWNQRPFVRRLLRYYCIVRLLGNVLNGITDIILAHVVRLTAGPCRGIPIPAQRVSTHARFYDSAESKSSSRFVAAFDVAFPCSQPGRHSG